MDHHLPSWRIHRDRLNQAPLVGTRLMSGSAVLLGISWQYVAGGAIKSAGVEDVIFVGTTASRGDRRIFDDFRIVSICLGWEQGAFDRDFKSSMDSYDGV